jgi:hypothetical protein
MKHPVAASDKDMAAFTPAGHSDPTMLVIGFIRFCTGSRSSAASPGHHQFRYRAALAGRSARLSWAVTA